MWHFVHDVVGAAAAAAEDLHVQSGLFHRFECGDIRLDGRQRLRPAFVEPDGVLNAAVVRKHAAKLEIPQLVN